MKSAVFTTFGTPFHADRGRAAWSRKTAATYLQLRPIFRNGPMGAVSVLICCVVIVMSQHARGQETAELPAAPLGESEQDVEILMRGPVHEAFAEPYVSDPEPGLVAPKQPPDPIEEIPAEREDVEGLQWIPGYWAWDEDRDDFIWVSGVWRKAPPGRTWVPGYWTEADGGWRWVSGFWTSAADGVVEYVPPPPESVESGPASPSPGDDYFYIPGCWVYQSDHYVWRAGYWTACRPDWVWIPSSYCWTPHGCVFVSGYWDYLPTHRGTLYAPVCFRRPVYLVDRYCYRPCCRIDTGPALFIHLFIHPRHHHYYFGDYYAAHYRSHIVPWVSISVRSHGYDPLHAFYAARHDHDSYLGRIRGWHHYFERHQEFRPAATLDAHRSRSRPLDLHVARFSRLGMLVNYDGRGPVLPVDDARRNRLVDSAQTAVIERLRALERQRAEWETRRREDRQRSDRDELARPFSLPTNAPVGITRPGVRDADRRMPSEPRAVAGSSLRDWLRQRAEQAGRDLDRRPEPSRDEGRVASPLRTGPSDRPDPRDRFGLRAAQEIPNALRSLPRSRSSAASPRSEGSSNTPGRWLERFQAAEGRDAVRSALPRASSSSDRGASSGSRSLPRIFSGLRSRSSPTPSNRSVAPAPRSGATGGSASAARRAPISLPNAARSGSPARGPSANRGGGLFGRSGGSSSGRAVRGPVGGGGRGPGVAGRGSAGGGRGSSGRGRGR